MSLTLDTKQFEEALRRKLEPIFGPDTQRRMDVMAMDAIRTQLNTMAA